MTRSRDTKMIETETDERRLRSVASRRALLESAAEAFARSGYEGATLESIAQDAGLNKALIRYHFGGKQGLYARVLLDALEVGAELLAPIKESKGSAPERLEAFIGSFWEFQDRVPHFAPIIVREWMCAGAHITPEVLKGMLQFFELDAEILAQGAEEGAFREVDPHAAHLSLVGALVFFQISEPLRRARRGKGMPRAPTHEEYAQHIQELFRRGLAGPARRPR